MWSPSSQHLHSARGADSGDHQVESCDFIPALLSNMCCIVTSQSVLTDQSPLIKTFTSTFAEYLVSSLKKVQNASSDSKLTRWLNAAKYKGCDASYSLYLCPEVSVKTRGRDMGLFQFQDLNQEYFSNMLNSLSKNVKYLPCCPWERAGVPLPLLESLTTADNSSSLSTGPKTAAKTKRLEEIFLLFSGACSDGKFDDRC